MAADLVLSVSSAGYTSILQSLLGVKTPMCGVQEMLLKTVTKP
jgi:hypothetical protein